MTLDSFPHEGWGGDKRPPAAAFRPSGTFPRKRGKDGRPGGNC